MKERRSHDTTTIVGSTTTDSTGSFSLGITIPATALPGQHSIQAKGQSSGLTVSRTFLVSTNWSQYGYDYTHSRTNHYENVLLGTNVSNLTLDWSYTTGDSIVSSPAVFNGVVYIGSHDRNVYALDAKTGTRLWSYTTGGSIDSSPAVVNSIVYIGSEDDNVYALNAKTGARKWSFLTSDSIDSTPAVTNGVVYVGTEAFYVFALNAKQGPCCGTSSRGGTSTPRPR